MPVSILTLMHNKITPKVEGKATTIDVAEKLYLSKIL